MKEDYSCVRLTLEVTRRLKCACPSYTYPHKLGTGLCKTSISSPPTFAAPKKGLAHKLCNFIDALELEVDSLTDHNYDRISYLLSEFKKEFYVGREAENI
jgi:hypothetical protein